MIDSHQHFWQLSRGDYPWPTADLATLYRDFTPADLAPLLQESGVDRTILVQAAPTAEETRFLLSLAERTPFVAGVVAWVDMAAPDAAQQILALAERPCVVGVRPMLQDIPDLDWILQPRLDSAFRALVEAGLVFDALIRPAHLERLRTILQRYPDLAVVVDHAAKPRIAAGEYCDWSRGISEVAAFEQCRCKMSGLLTEAGDRPSIGHIKPYVERVLEAFGPARIMWGSDWPVLTLAADYSTWVDMSAALLMSLSSTEKDQIMELTAARTYRLRPCRASRESSQSDDGEQCRGR